MRQGHLMMVSLLAPLLVLTVVSIARIVQHDAGFGPVALLAAGAYLTVVAPLWSWLAAKGLVPSGLGLRGSLLLAGYGVSLALRGSGLLGRGAYLLVLGAGTVCLGALADQAARSGRHHRPDQDSARRSKAARLRRRPGNRRPRRTGCRGERGAALAAEPGRLEGASAAGAEAASARAGGRSVMQASSAASLPPSRLALSTCNRAATSCSGSAGTC